MSKFQVAGAAEIFRLTEKDEYYTRYMRNLFSEIFQKFFGVHHWLKWKDVYDSLSDFTYFFITTISGLQTLGEEYVYVVQTDVSCRKLPSTKRRFLGMTLRIFGPLVLLILKKYLEKKKRNEESEQNCDHNYASALFWVLSSLQRLHLILFYFDGSFYEVSKRLTGVKYVLLRRWLGQMTNEKPYQILGYIASVQFLISLFVDIKKFYANPSTDPMDNVQSNTSAHQDVNIASQCVLCFEKRRDTTATPCGHLFCWNCITNWLQSKEECPLCRERFDASRLVCLQNYT